MSKKNISLSVLFIIALAFLSLFHTVQIPLNIDSHKSFTLRSSLWNGDSLIKSYEGNNETLSKNQILKIGYSHSYILYSIWAFEPNILGEEYEEIVFREYNIHTGLISTICCINKFETIANDKNINLVSIRKIISDNYNILRVIGYDLQNRKLRRYLIENFEFDLNQ